MEDLADVIQEFLRKGGKYLIVLDDVWSVETWEIIKNAFPENNKCNRVLVMTRDSGVAIYCNSIPHYLKFLIAEESWTLLEKKFFHNDKCPITLKLPGESIAKKCSGLPIAIALIAGALRKEKTTRHWERVNQTVAFPSGFQIPSWKLIRLWIAEGFIQYKRGSSLECKAEDNLNDLVNRNLLMVTTRTSDGKIKTCRVHDILHEFCRQEAMKE
ncbi:hypothetical protein RND71_039142 [Anisodus tanguticus]|uniref:Uncharacterized protein n=1 Tax=Anisodus tanguticus TaxID=243964 RepID=A0AAE1QWE8_9SOLA|nr:hypothetical protein RND71_039142 [Anisodus tanguticus]